MSGILTIRNDYSDAHSVTLTLDSKGDGGTTRLGATLKIDVGRQAKLKMPDFLVNDSEDVVKTDTESKDQKLERLEARIKEYEQFEENQLVASDNTDAYRIKSLMTALKNEKDKTKNLNSVEKFVSQEFHQNLSSLNDDQLDEVGGNHDLHSQEENADKRSALKNHFENSDITEKIELLKSTRVSQDEDDKRQAKNAHDEKGHHLEQDRDAANNSSLHGGWGSDSTTANADLAKTREEDGEEEVQGNNQDERREEGSTGESDDEYDPADALRQTQETRSSGDTGPTATGPSRAQFDDSDEDANEMRDNANETLEKEGHSGDKIKEKADEALNEAEKAEDQASTSREKAEETKEVADQDESAEDQETTSEEVSSGGPVDLTNERTDVNLSSQDSDDDFRSRVNKLKNSQLELIESGHDNLSGKGNQKERKDALKEAYANADDDQKKQLSDDVDAALEG